MNNVGKFRRELYGIVSNLSPLHGAIATTNSSNKPEVAIMGYVIKKDLTIILNTDSGSRKWINLANNHNIALAIGWSGTEPFVQLEGIAKRITRNTSSFAQIEKIYFSQHPHSGEFKELPTSVFIVVTPQWARLIDPRTKPRRIVESMLL